MPDIDLARWHVDIDTYLNPIIPSPPWRWLPRPISHFLGYRGDKPPKVLGNLVIAFWSLLGVFCGVLVVAEVSMHVPAFQHHNAPIIVASFGAAAVLEFSAVESPFAQPRNAVLSQVMASAIGIGIGKLFALNAHAHSLPQIGGALACAITTAVMVLTKTVHPPAGATALLAVTEGGKIGWFLVLIMFLGCVMMQAVALLINNIQRRFPVYWWTPESLSRPKLVDPEIAGGKKESSWTPSSSSDDDVTNVPAQIVLQEGKVSVPDNVLITAEEMAMLEKISERIRYSE
ncbi:HPP family-domain-containing protein [Aspergillus avenaceus]|uniref:HPP family-domain-containing protein n=1 Tax=Aspergillus avenaceus TaxID=36643 RepID=A0A5N6U4K5_ASPAV|nr:HPP family-domain-containing protein [Aspergillus avenaceus]